MENSQVAKGREWSKMIETADKQKENKAKMREPTTFSRSAHFKNNSFNSLRVIFFATIDFTLTWNHQRTPQTKTQWPTSPRSQTFCSLHSPAIEMSWMKKLMKLFILLLKSMATYPFTLMPTTFSLAKTFLQGNCLWKPSLTGLSVIAYH